MNRLSLRNNQLKFKTLGKILLIIEEFYRIYVKLLKKNQKFTTCNQLDLEALEFDWLCSKISLDTN